MASSLPLHVMRLTNDFENRNELGWAQNPDPADWASSTGTIEELKKQTGAKDPPIVFDMECVTLVDIEVVRFLNACEKSGIELIHCSP